MCLSQVFHLLLDVSIAVETEKDVTSDHRPLNVCQVIEHSYPWKSGGEVTAVQESITNQGGLSRPSLPSPLNIFIWPILLLILTLTGCGCGDAVA